MKSLKESFTELRKSTPKHAQWLLLAAAFIVVLILLSLIFKGKSKQDVGVLSDAAPVLNIEPQSLDWSSTTIGQTKKQEFVISSNLPVKIKDIRLQKEAPGLKKPLTTCKTISQIDKNVPCTITMEYSPDQVQDNTAISLFVDWIDRRDIARSDTMTYTEKIVISIGAVEKVKSEPVPPPKPEPEPEPEPDPISDPLPAPKIKPEPDPKPIPEPKPEPKPAPEQDSKSCFDFAFPGYNASGQQIGWIRPQHGEYVFHPFADKKCASPTGIYNPDNGIISDINNPSKKIGTDAEHIGYGAITSGTIPQLSNSAKPRAMNKALQLDSEQIKTQTYTGFHKLLDAPKPEKLFTSSGETVVSSKPYDRSFLLRQYKPIPATIVSEIRADLQTLNDKNGLPVTATVDRNVYSDNGRNIIIPTGTMILGYVTGDIPGPYKTIGRMHIKWYQFIRPDGVEFNFGTMDKHPFSADSQGRAGVPGHGSSDYLEQFVMPLLTAVVPAAVNMIAPIADKFVNQIDLDNNTVTQSGQVRSSELAKQEVITTWNKIANKLMVDMMDNTVPPFSIAAGTRITVFSPVDLLVTCGVQGDNTKACAIQAYSEETRFDISSRDEVTQAKEAENIGSMSGQVRSFNLEPYCTNDVKTGNKTVDESKAKEIQEAGLDYRTVLFYCQSLNYQAINTAKQNAVFQNQQQTSMTTTNASGEKVQMTIGSEDYNKNVLGLEYKDDGTIKNPFQKEAAPVATGITCEDGTKPDPNGCCTGETYTDMGEDGFNCCPAGSGDCFPPIL
ncbi:MAG: TrbI/VirB10 family protein [Rickettsiales bacterium]|jgi:type IV secretory pathway VirB10-like protein|nr:TrbI/VirB10 family protein [Rickettsiales bacterium]